MLNEETILSAIGSTGETSFSEFCQALGDDVPDEKSEWAKLFKTLRDLQRHGFVDITEVGGKVDSMILTEPGAARVRDRLDAKRDLLQRMR